VLLTFDRYAYEIPGHGAIGRAEAPLLISGRLTGNPPARIPAIRTRIGIDLHPVDVHSPEERRWLLALCLPEFREQQARLATALDVVARTDMRMLQGDALDLLPEALNSATGPVCVFHSVCLLYWSAEARSALHRMLLEAGRSRDIHRLGFELWEGFDAFHAGRADAPSAIRRPEGATFDITLTRYSGGRVAREVIAHMTPDFTSLHWLA
jgi:hypothetical protein